MSGFRCYYCNLTTLGIKAEDMNRMINNEEHNCLYNKGALCLDDNNIFYLEEDSALITNATNNGLESAHSSDPVNFIDGTTEDNSAWKKEVILLLIEKFEENKLVLEKKNTIKKHIWKRINDEINAHGYNYSWDQVQNKWKGLSRTYKSIKDNNNQTGRDRKNWAFYDHFDKLLARDPTIDSPILCENGATRKSLSRSSTPSVSSEKAEDATEQELQIEKQKKRDMKDIILKAMEQQQKQHEEDLQEKKRFNDLLTSLINTLNKYRINIS